MSEQASVESVEEFTGNDKVVDPFGPAPISLEEALRGARETGRINEELAKEIEEGKATIIEGEA